MFVPFRVQFRIRTKIKVSVTVEKLSHFNIRRFLREELESSRNGYSISQGNCSFNLDTIITQPLDSFIVKAALLSEITRENRHSSSVVWIYLYIYVDN